MTDLVPLTPLGATEPHVETIGTVTITEVTGRALASIAARKGKEAALGKAWAKLDCGAQPGVSGAVFSDSHLAFWSSPKEWLVDADIEKHPNWSMEVSQTLQGDASVTEQSGAWCRFELSGEKVLEVFERLCALDISQVAVGSALRTSVHHLNCIVIRTDDAWLVTGPGSTAGDLLHALQLAAKAAV